MPKPNRHAKKKEPQERRHSTLKAFLIWACLCLVGVLLNAFIMDKELEASALRRVSKWHGYQRRDRFDIAVVDISSLLEWFPTTDKNAVLNTKHLGVFLEAVVSNLEPKYRPKVIAFDIACIQRDNKFTEQANNESLYMPHEDFVRLVASYSNKSKIRFLIGSETMHYPTSTDGAPGTIQVDENLYSGLKNSWCSVVAFNDSQRAPLSFNQNEPFDLLGISAVKAAGYDRLKYTPVGPLDEWPKDLPEPKCIYVNYHILDEADKLTLSVPELKGSHLDWNKNNMFGPSFKKRLNQIGIPPVWIVGVAKGPNDGDWIAVDSKSYSPSESRIMRGIYQQVAIADSALHSPIRRATHSESIFLEVLFSLLAFSMIMGKRSSFQPPTRLAVRDLHRWIWFAVGRSSTLPADILFLIRRRFRRRRQALNHYELRAMERSARIIIAIAPILASYLMARYWGYYWLGFLATWTYIFIEPFIEKNVLGISDEPFESEVLI